MRWRIRRSRAGSTRCTSCAGAFTASSRGASPRARPRRSTGSRTARCLRRRQVHRLPLLHAGVSVGRADGGVGPARPEDREVHALRGPHEPAAADRLQRAAAPQDETKRFMDTIATPACVKACPADALRFGTARRCWRCPQAHREPARQVRGSHLWREGARRHERRVPLVRSVREARVPDLGEKPFPALDRGGARSGPARRDGGGRPARRHLRLLPQARAGGRGRLGSRGTSDPTTAATSSSSGWTEAA